MSYRRLLRALLLVSIAAALVSASPGAGQGASAASTAATPVVRFSNPALGYSLLTPSTWTHLTGVRWAPGGIPASLTFTTSDHQALLGVLVQPTGGRTYTSSELQQVGDDLIYQEDAVQGGQTQHERVVINHTVFQASIATFRQGGELQSSSWMAVLVTTSHRRLYAFAGLVYDRSIHFIKQSSNGNDEPTPTPTNIAFDRQPNSRPAGESRVAFVAASSIYGVSRTSTAPLQNSAAVATEAPPAIERAGRNACPSLLDSQNPVVIDKNCSFGAERLLVAQSFSSIIIHPIADDPRPAPIVGIDGFAHKSDQLMGYSLAYPATWALTSGAGGGDGFVARAPDHNAVVATAAQPQGSTSLSTTALETLGDHEIEQTADIQFSKLTHHIVRQNGVVFAISDDDSVHIDLGAGGATVSHATAAVVAYHRRIYAVVAVVNHILPGTGDFNDVQARYFAPFDAVARQEGATNFDAHDRSQQLALAALASLSVDSHSTIDAQPAPSVSIDGFTTRHSATNGYTVRYPAAWKPITAKGTDVAVQSPDKRVTFTLAVQATGGKNYTTTELHGVIDRELAQIGEVIPGATKYETQQTADGTLVFAVAANVKIPISTSDSNVGTATVAVEERRHRLYDAVAFVSSYTLSDPSSSDFTRSDINQQLVVASIADVVFDSHTADDAQPAPAVGIDGFIRYHGNQGCSISYPATWTQVANSSGAFTVRSVDKRVILAVVAQSTNGKTYSNQNLAGIADQQIGQIGEVVSPITHGTAHLAGVNFLTAVADVSPGNTTQSITNPGAFSHALVIAAVHNGRIYGVFGLVQRSAGAGDNNAAYNAEIQIVLAVLSTTTLT